MKSHVVVLAVLMLVFLPTASATSITGQMTVDSAELHDIEGAAQLVSLKFLADNGTLPTGFHVQAESLRLELDQTAYSAVVDSERVDYDYTTTPSNHAQAVIAPMPSGPEVRWGLEAAPGREPPRVAISSACVGVDSATFDTVASTTVVNRAERPDRSTSVADALRLRPCAETTLVITGDFLLSLWDWDFHLNADDGGHVIETGVHPRSDGLGDQATEAYLYARNATLTTTIDSDPAAFFVNDATLDAAAARLFNARGALDLGGQGLTLAGDELDLRGDLRLDLDGTDARAPYRVFASGATATDPLAGGGVRLNGEWVSSTTPVPQSPLGGASSWLQAPPYALAAGLLLVFLFRPIVAYRKGIRDTFKIDITPKGFRQTWAAGNVYLASQQIHLGRPRRTVLYAKLARWAWPSLSDGPFMVGLARLKYGAIAQAKEDLQYAYRRAKTSETKALICCLIAKAALDLGKEQDTIQRWFKRAKKHHPTVVGAFLSEHNLGVDHSNDGFA